MNIFQRILELLGFGRKEPAEVEIETPALEAAKPVLGAEDIEAADGHDEYAGLLEREPATKTPEEWGFGDIELRFKVGDDGDEVKAFQEQLESLGYELSRFGADGSLGDETLSEVKDFQDDHDLSDAENALKARGVGERTFDAVTAAFGALPKDRPTLVPPPAGYEETIGDGIPFIDIRETHSGKKRPRRRSKGWKDVKGITLHQTATEIGPKPERYRNVACHIGIPSDGKVIYVNGLEWVVWHGNAFNNKDVGFEIDGHFAGVEKLDEETGQWLPDISTYWRPKSKPERQPLTVTEEQIKSTLAAIDWVIEEVARHGGKVEYLHAHRQSSTGRVSDPGEKVWKLIALPAMEKHGLKDGGPGFKLGGWTIPNDWNPEYDGKYRQYNS
jgi:N-acetyl-anhydromuramyl-L-alanine amidase AmpD